MVYASTKKYVPTFHLRGSDMKLTVSGLKMINYCCTHHFVQDRKLRHSQFFILIKSNGNVCLQFNFTRKLHDNTIKHFLQQQQQQQQLHLPPHSLLIFLPHSRQVGKQVVISFSGRKKKVSKAEHNAFYIVILH